MRKHLAHWCDLGEYFCALSDTVTEIVGELTQTARSLKDSGSQLGYFPEFGTFCKGELDRKHRILGSV